MTSSFPPNTTPYHPVNQPNYPSGTSTQCSSQESRQPFQAQPGYQSLYPPAPYPYYNPNPYEAPCPPPQQFSGPQYQQQHGPTPPQNSNGRPVPKSLLFIKSGRDFMSLVTPDRSRSLYVVRYAGSFSSDPGVVVLRGGSRSGPQVGSATFHSWTTSKVDLDVGGRVVKLKKEFDSTTGLGHLRWHHNKQRHRHHHHQGGGGGGSGSGARLELLDTTGRVLAAFTANKTSSFFSDDTSRHEGRFEIILSGAGVSQAQFDEIVVSGVAEMERRRKSAEDDDAVLDGTLWALAVNGN
ncbi:hypothetical protein BX600DRAFT_460995 [Xylariales sp. PMI_506]|nr:hypothetical protein BX600DRAFT_460995 [Xylariales sp. PMI_506]